MMLYSQKFRTTMLAKMTGVNPVSASALSREAGVAQSTLSRWLRDAGASVEGMPTSRQLPSGKRPQDWTPEERLSLVMRAEGLKDEELGELLRKAGVHSSQLEEWRKGALGGIKERPYRGKRSEEARRIRSLEAEVRRKDKALAEAAALLILKKKVEELWGDEDEPTSGKNGK